MAFRTARMSSLSSKMSSCQGVSFQSISRRGNLGLDREESGTCALDVPGPCGAWSIWAWSLTRSSFTPPGLALMASTSMIHGEADIPTSPRAPPPPASSPRGGVIVLESVAGGRVATLSSAAGGGVAVLALSTSDCAVPLWSNDLVREGEA
jgi:hypothetical protein